jgi:hypothetical protein
MEDKIIRLSDAAKQIGMSKQLLLRDYVSTKKLHAFRYKENGWYSVYQSEVDRFKKEEVVK